jgi:polar amino acid transport system permease protein
VVVTGLGLHFSTYTSKVFRAGIENVPTGQWEASKALNYNGYQTMRHVILPQAIPAMIPPLANYLITMFKETPLLSAITVVELSNAANIFSNSNYKYPEPMTLVGVFFLIVSVPAAYLAMKLEKKYSPKNTGAARSRYW